MKRFHRALFATFAALIFAWAMLRPVPENDDRVPHAQSELNSLHALSKLPKSRPTAQPTATPTPQSIMATETPKIARGTTGQALFVQRTDNDNNAGEWDITSGGDYSNSNAPVAKNHGSGVGTNGWNMSGATVTVPLGAVNGVMGGEISDGTGKGDFYRFEVVCMTVTLDIADHNDGTYTATATPHGGTAPFTYNWTLPTGATKISGDGNTRTFTSDGGDVSVGVSDADTPTACSASATTHICVLSASVSVSSNGETPNGDGLKFAVAASASSGTPSYSANCQFPDGATDTSDFATFGAIGNGAYLGYAYFTLPYPASQYAFGVSVNIYDSANPSCAKTRSATYVFSPKGTAPDDPSDPPSDPTDPNNPDDPTTPTTPPNEDGAGCCMPGYYRQVAGGPCILVTTGGGDNGGGTSDPSVLPAVPDAPTAAKDCAKQVINVTAPAMPARATSIEIARDDAPEIVIALPDTKAGATARKYRARGVNSEGRSAWGAYSNAVSLVSALAVPAWVMPDDGTAVSGIATLIATAPPRSTLHADTPLTMKLFGADLAPIYNPKTGQWIARFDTNVEYQGTVTIQLQARDVAGCYTLPVPLTLSLNNSIERGARWSELFITPDLTAEIAANGHEITEVALEAELRGAGAGDWRRWYVTAPDPGAPTATQLSDYAIMRDRVKDWQDFGPGALVTLRDAATSARMAMETQSAEVVSLYDLRAAKVIKMRQYADEAIEIATDAAYLRFDDSGVTVLALWADYERPTVKIAGLVVDAARVENKFYVAISGSSDILVLDGNAGKISARLSPDFDERPLVSLETLGVRPLAIYSDDNSATVYALESSIDDPLVLESQIFQAFVSDERLFIEVDDSGPDYPLSVVEEVILTDSGKSEIVPIAVAYPSATAVNVNSGIVEIGNAAGDIRTIDGEDVSTVAQDLGGEVSGIARFKGSAETLRRVATLADGDNVARLFLAVANGGLLPAWTLRDLSGNLSTRTTGAARIVTTLRKPSGDPLQGGDAGLFSESLAVTFETSKGAFLARLQEAGVDKDKARRVRAIGAQEFKAVGFGFVETPASESNAA